jgi:hypothetical protein
MKKKLKNHTFLIMENYLKLYSYDEFLINNFEEFIDITFFRKKKIIYLDIKNFYG